MNADLDRAMALVKLLNAETPTLRTLVIEGEPCSKARPRLGKRGSFYTPSKPAEEALAWQLKQGMREPFKSGVAVACIFYRSNRQRIDADNLLKLVLDAATGVCWKDDSQVTAMLAVLEHDPDRPRTVVAFAEHESSMRRGEAAWAVCQHCGESFDAKSQPKKFCSVECRRAARGVDLSEPVMCLHCGEPFRRPWSGAKLCSEPCRIEWLRGQRKGTGHGNTCIDCGTPLAKADAQRCRACWQASASAAA